VAERPRILLVPTLTQIEWKIRPLLQEWADVAAYDAPGVGDEPRPDRLTEDTVLDRGIAELDGMGWEKAVVVGDEVGAVSAARLAGRAPERVAGLALGHAALSFEREGERAAINAEVFEVLLNLARFDHRTFARAVAQSTQGAFDEDLVEGYIERVPEGIGAAYLEVVTGRMDEQHLGELLARLDMPILIAEHRDCAMWTAEGFAEAAAALPDAMTLSTVEKPSTSPDFAEALRRLCADLPA
jgi:pimeloyl-ACP methyl ester carboxylesterase